MLCFIQFFGGVNAILKSLRGIKILKSLKIPLSFLKFPKKFINILNAFKILIYTQTSNCTLLTLLFIFLVVQLLMYHHLHPQNCTTISIPTPSPFTQWYFQLHRPSSSVVELSPFLTSVFLFSQYVPKVCCFFNVAI